MKYEVCDHCRHCHGKSHEYTGDGVKHYGICRLNGCRVSLWDECDKWEEKR